MKTTLCLLALGLIGFGIYLPGLGIQYYEDDLNFIFDPTPPSFFYYFTHKHPHLGFYRPIEASILSFIQYYCGLNTVPIHIILIILHVCLSSIIFFAVLKLGYSYIQAIIGSLFMLISQANAFAVLSNDTLSQVSGTLFGCISLFFLHTFCSNNELAKNSSESIKYYRYYGISVFAFGVALLSKESSISFFLPLLAIVAAFTIRTPGHTSSAAKKIFTVLLPFFCLVSFYLVVRFLIGASQPGTGDTRYDFHIGINIIKNLLMFLFALVIPASSINAFVAFKNNDIFRLLIFAFSSLALISFVVNGLWHSNEKSKIAFIAALVVLSLFPMAMLNHVSELYAYNAMPFLSILVGIGLGEILKSITAHNIIQPVFIILFISFSVSHIVAIQSKIAFMKRNGERAAALINQIGLYIDKIPKKGELLLLNTSKDAIEYSGFLLRDFNVLNYGQKRIKKVYGREDITIKIVDHKYDKRSTNRKDSIMLVLVDGSTVLYNEDQGREK
jgi:hypothetical protein